MDSAPDRSWFYAVAGAQNGPVSPAALAEMLRTGKLSPGTLVWAQGMADWKAAGQVEELRGFMPAAPPTQPGPIRSPVMVDELGQNVGVRMLIPVGRSYWAILAGYLGLFALIPMVGLVLGPGGVFCGIMAVRHMKRDPRRHGMGRAVTGIVLGLVGTVISIGVLLQVLRFP